MPGHSPTVVAIRAITGPGERDNLTVSQLHTYYVVVGDAPVLVHNMCARRAGDDGYRTPRGNQQQNRSFADAIKEGQRTIGRQLTKDEVRRVHDDISGQGYDYHDIVDTVVGMFGESGEGELAAELEGE